MKKHLFIILLILSISCTSTKYVTEPVVDIIPLDAGMLYYYFTNNQSDATERYTGKELLIDGKIVEFYKNKDGLITIILAQSEDINGVECILSIDYELYTPLKKGDKIKIEGTCTEFNSNLKFTDCEIIE